MKTNPLIWAILFAAGASAQLVWGQPIHPVNYPYAYVHTHPYSFTYYSPYGYYHHASTVEEGMANGLANLIASAGAANLLHSQAARNYAEARSRYLDNRLKAEQTYFEMRRINREARAAERGPRPTAEQMFRYARARAPNRLGPTELDPLTGKIAWPNLLEADAFRAQRERLDELFALRARYHGQIGPEQYLELCRVANDMDAELKSRIREYAPGDYVKAKNIIKSLAYEASLIMG